MFGIDLSCKFISVLSHFCKINRLSRDVRSQIFRSLSPKAHSYKMGVAEAPNNSQVVLTNDRSVK